MKLGITQFFLTFSLICNPVAGLAATTLDAFETQSSVSGDMPCEKDMQRSQITDHDAAGDQDVPLHDCSSCNSEDCSINSSCQSCLNLPINAILLESLGLNFSIPLKSNLENGSCHIQGRPILPEIPPPTPIYLS